MSGRNEHSLVETYGEGPQSAAITTGPLTRRMGARAFLKLIAASAAAAVGGHSLGARSARATYTPGSPDVVNTNLTVQGNVVVTSGGKMGIGVASPQGMLDVAGDIRVNGTEAVASNGVARQSYYSLDSGSWAVAAMHTWGECASNNWTWEDLATLTQ